jgi:hypothetical protein
MLENQWGLLPLKLSIFRLVTIDIHLFQKITLDKEFANYRNSPLQGRKSVLVKLLKN